ncbi:glucosidase II beta subunit-like protein, partial [Opisthorchis viverrini]
ALAAAVEQARSLKRREVERGHSIFKEYVTKLKVRREEERIAAEQAERERQLKAEEDEEPSGSQVTPPSQTSPEPHSGQSVEVPLEPQSFDSSKSSEFEDPAIKDRGEHDVPVEHEDEPHQEESDQSENAEGHHNDESPPLLPPPKPEPIAEPPKPIDYGPEEAFYMLKDLPECLEYTDPQYTYRFCAFKDIHQRDKGSTADGTLLGRWSGWATEQEDAPVEQKYSLMKFSDGWGCWNGPARSVKVHVHCSDENKITDVKEPSRCEYEMQLYTPAACFQHPEVLLRRIHEEL